MARSCSFTHFLLVFFAAFLLTSECTLVKVPPNDRVAGVFMLIEGGDYTMNFTAATAACLVLNVTMATRAQMERAVQLGLETCKYGWIHGKIAAIPRLNPDNNCGKGKTGVVTWYARESMKFGVFCFNASDLEKTPKASTAQPQTYASSTTLTALTPTSTPTAALMGSTSRSLTSTTVTSKAPSAFTLLVKTPTPSARISSTSPPFKPFSTSIPTSRTQLTSVVPFTFFTVIHDTNVSVSSESVLPQSVSSAKPSLGAVPTVLITLGIILLLLTAAGAAWFYKLKRNSFTCWSQGQQNDNTETEMWIHNDSEMDLHSQHEEEESDRKYFSEVTLRVNPNIKTNPEDFD